jgi:aspartyl protease
LLVAYHASLVSRGECSCAKHKIPTIRKVESEEILTQLSVKVKVNNKTVETIIDSGATINYINKEWSEKMKLMSEDSGIGNI